MIFKSLFADKIIVMLIALPVATGAYMTMQDTSHEVAVGKGYPQLPDGTTVDSAINSGAFSYTGR